jgi:hypothetical protein
VKSTSTKSRALRPSRRRFLQGTGVALALPWLETLNAKAASIEPPRRMVAIETNMGILPQFFFPKTNDRGYELSPYLQRIKDHRDQLTVFSGVSLPGVTGGHAAERCFLTGTPHPERGGFRNGVSLDQFAAERIGSETRYSSLVLAVTQENPTLSYTRSGAPIPAEKSPRALFEKLFFQGNEAEIQANIHALRQGRSLLDFVGGQSRQLNQKLTPNDRQRLDQYLTAVRDLEQQLQNAEAWEKRPKPQIQAEPPQDITDAKAFAARTRQMFDVIQLALATDSTRLVTLFIDTTVIHNITHHGNRPEVISELRSNEEAQFDALNQFLSALASSTEESHSLLDRTMVLYGTCMGSANSHSNTNLPVLLAGGGFQHGQHLAFDAENNYPLSNLYVSMLQRLGIETDSFSSGSGTFRGLEMVG